ncbi:MAG TPA: iron-sulfur cluster assembly accessory protein [Stenomitos sp.]
MINLSEAAIGEIKRLQLRRHKPEAQLRLGVQQGGCADLYYTIDFEDAPKSNDRVYACGDISIVVDEESCNYISELTLDYSEDLMGGGFRFHNPKAVESCGCGNSFRVASDLCTQP